LGFESQTLNVNPGSLTSYWNLQISHLERKMIFQFPDLHDAMMFHVNLQGCSMICQANSAANFLSLPLPVLLQLPLPSGIAALRLLLTKN